MFLDLPPAVVVTHNPGGGSRRPPPVFVHFYPSRDSRRLEWRRGTAPIPKVIHKIFLRTGRAGYDIRRARPVRRKILWIGELEGGRAGYDIRREELDQLTTGAVAKSWGKQVAGGGRQRHGGRNYNDVGASGEDDNDVGAGASGEDDNDVGAGAFVERFSSWGGGSSAARGRSLWSGGGNGAAPVEGTRPHRALLVRRKDPSADPPGGEVRAPIPKVIHKIFLRTGRAGYDIRREELDLDIRASIDSWEDVGTARHNPGFRVRFWNEHRIRRFLKQGFGPEVLFTYDRIVPESWRTNFARYAIVYKLGGWYADIKTVLLRPIDEALGLIPDSENKIRPMSSHHDASSDEPTTDEPRTGEDDRKKKTSNRHHVDYEPPPNEQLIMSSPITPSTPIFFCDRQNGTMMTALFRAPAGFPWLKRALENMIIFVRTNTYSKTPLMMGPANLGSAAMLRGCCVALAENSLDPIASSPSKR